MGVNALAQVTLVRIYIALVQIIDCMKNAPVVYIKRMESKPTRSRACLLSKVVM